MSDEDYQMDEAIRLYSEESTFAEIANELEVSKSYAQKLVRLGIAKTLKKLGNEKEAEPEALTATGSDFETEVIQPQTMVSHQPQLLEPLLVPQPSQLSYADQEYELELTAIPKKITLTAYHIGIFDVFVNGGYPHDLSTFAQDAFEFMFARTTPQGRAN